MKAYCLAGKTEALALFDDNMNSSLRGGITPDAQCLTILATASAKEREGKLAKCLASRLIAGPKSQGVAPPAIEAINPGTYVQIMAGLCNAQPSPHLSEAMAFFRWMTESSEEVEAPIS